MKDMSKTLIIKRKMGATPRKPTGKTLVIKKATPIKKTKGSRYA